MFFANDRLKGRANVTTENVQQSLPAANYTAGLEMFGARCVLVWAMDM